MCFVRPLESERPIRLRPGQESLVASEYLHTHCHKTRHKGDLRRYSAAAAADERTVTIAGHHKTPLLIPDQECY